MMYIMHTAPSDVVNDTQLFGPCENSYYQLTIVQVPMVYASHSSAQTQISYRQG